MIIHWQIEQMSLNYTLEMVFWVIEFDHFVFLIHD